MAVSPGGVVMFTSRHGWSHGHSLGTGAIMALALSGHLLWFLSAAALGGFLLGRSWGAVGSAARWLGGVSGHRLRLERERWLEVRARRRTQLERSRGLRAERDKAETAAYWRGVRDGTP